MPPISKTDIHATGATASVLSFITWLLGRYVFHSGTVPPEVTGAILLILPWTISLATGYAVRHRIMADARAAMYVMGLGKPTPPAVAPVAPPAASGPDQTPPAP